MVGVKTHIGSGKVSPLGTWTLDGDDPELMRHWNSLPGGPLAFCDGCAWSYQRTFQDGTGYLHEFKHGRHPANREPRKVLVRATEGWAPGDELGTFTAASVASA